jgi:SAM-dependent methyltransferase
MSTSLDINTPAFWEEIYQGDRAGWDLGGPTPVFRRLLMSGEFAPGRAIVLGAGRGHDACEFARQGFTVTAVDFAADAVRDMRALADPQAPIEILQADIFTLPHTLDGTFDYVIEYTCFCAIDPSRRADYIDLVKRLLKPGGICIGLFFPLDQREGGPPFAVSLSEILAIFGARGFTLLRRETPTDSVPQRAGLEELLIWQAP